MGKATVYFFKVSVALDARDGDGVRHSFRPTFDSLADACAWTNAKLAMLGGDVDSPAANDVAVCPWSPSCDSREDDWRCETCRRKEPATV